MSRTTTIIALVQTLVVVLGFVAVGLVLKASGYPDNPGWVRWNQVAVFLRHHGGWLMLVPILWTYAATVALNDDRSRVSYSMMVVVGIAFAIVAGIAFMYASVCPFTRSPI
ncbi:MAG: hypothetical protein V4662_21555 [Verrucomicrobiota bacterium]